MVKVVWVFIGVIVFAFFCVWIGIPLIFRWFVDAKFSEGSKDVVWISLGYFFQGMYLLFANIIFYLKRTKILFYLSFINIIINLSLNYFLIPMLGHIGAAYAICISVFVFCIKVEH